MKRFVRVSLLLAALGATMPGCRRDGRSPVPSPAASGSALPSEPPPWDSGPKTPAAPEGMVWIPDGALVAGTPPGVLPRVADEEMSGEQVVLHGFFISIYPYPNEEGAIPLFNVTQEQAKSLCEERKQRLCTELEWERACKGPENHIYEYGDHYRPDVCGTGTVPRMLPSGLRVACRSDFGVRDLHGSLSEWTASEWGRGGREGLVAVRGGNAPAGELAGRCANAFAKSPTSKSAGIGFRCCAGPPNEAKVELHVERKTPMEKFELSAALAKKIDDAIPDDARAELRRDESFHATQAWLWHPIGNEELVVAGGCTGETRGRGCGAVVVRLVLGAPVSLAWAGSGRFLPSVKLENDPRYLWVYGGDERSHFRKGLTYAWGRVVGGEVQRNVHVP
ncbi:MAG TPA: SUMF1/EgtB/PvdO family nonheme iron enzyme [Polyangiaceae bacterium]|nr:SUMF1/EgtB/PvdO family nonheme iron enzyme [Polyangiaceae bacterium]